MYEHYDDWKLDKVYSKELEALKRVDYLNGKENSHDRKNWGVIELKSIIDTED